jgi:amino-acid N-acetyltransferase
MNSALAVGRTLSGPPVASATLRQATPDDAGAIHELITSHRDEGRLLPRHLGEIAVHTPRFVVALDEGEVVGCVDLAPLSRTVAEIRSLVVSEDARSSGIGGRLIDAVIARAKAAGFERVCAFTHAPSYFVQLGFSIVPHDWLPEKIRTNCGTCPQFRTCGQWAVMLPIRRTVHG